MSATGTRTLGGQPRRCVASAPPTPTLRAFVHAVRAWLAARRRDADDRAAFARMSERELRDIGVDRGSIEWALHRRGTREWLDR
jgi:uncharacterized protein YjiS (DUF1127 family)